MPKRLLHRPLPPLHWICWLKIGIGGGVGIALVAGIGEMSGIPLLIAPFGATAVLLFGAPSSPLAQPPNVILGHVVVSMLAIVLRAVLPPDWWAMGLAVGLAMLLMAVLRITHPPAGADPIVIFLSDPGPEFVLVPILAGSLLLMTLAMIVHRIPPRTTYPLPPK
ncbi:hypothetical protein JCM17960_28560 [Magnetospira thiophila]